MIDLKPCPFCGGAVEMYVDGLPENGEAQLQFAQCEQCGALGPTDEDYDFAAHLWNTRPDSLTLTAAVQGEREAIIDALQALRDTDEKHEGTAVYGIGLAQAVVKARSSPAVDVMAVVREYVEADDAFQRGMGGFDSDAERKAAGDRWLMAFYALRSLVAASPKAKKPAHKGESDEQS